ncbi:sigma-70 family RNA polymerase sigma factor [Alginatibacterium sediminis]|uniref:Sigma-70 family RNA polymerase sigma factor n=1 Tax=Alginatibacterium sediminis TaxID=2164068 RepID=A0A420ED75_9ALTE|nr:sigma-70 family RNA polymerase sigma factor [Alginatibacterium sediminis]RKF18689.1 sigma-70 family RNA polymerase sigma factor [Alginatibacterium sediminis]
MRKYNPSTPSSAVPCLMETWHLSESELYHWLLKHTNDPQLSFDLLQDTFLKALQQEQDFCDILNQRAWLYRVTRNLLVDRQRKANQEQNLPLLDYEPLWVEQEVYAIDSLAQCIPKALNKLSPSESQIIQQCDLQGMSQQSFASEHGLTIVATKSRIQRARKKLKTILQKQCHIQFDEQQRVCCFFKE